LWIERLKNNLAMETRFNDYDEKFSDPMLDIEEKSYHNCLKLIWTLTGQVGTTITVLIASIMQTRSHLDQYEN
jgi:hypothetical protein